jgi:hypothetical protein
MVARYVPPLFHHSVWFYGEYSVNKVHSFDAYDSEKYPEVEDLVELLLNRYLLIEDIEEYPMVEKVVHIITNRYSKGENIFIEKTEDEVKELQVEPGSDAMPPLYANGEANGSYNARIGIWKGYINRINISGHKIEEPHFWLTEKYCVPHAHNVFLEFTYNFGGIIGILFFLGYVICAIQQGILTYKTKSFTNFTILVMIVLFGVFGMVELDFFIGQAPLTFFFFMLCHIIWNEKKDKNIDEKIEL